VENSGIFAARWCIQWVTDHDAIAIICEQIV